MTEQNIKYISADDLHSKMEIVVVADIRDPNSFAQGHVPGAINLNNENIQAFVDDNEFTKPVVVICYSGHSSIGAAQVLANVGFINMSSLTGGMGAWRLQFPEKINQL